MEFEIQLFLGSGAVADQSRHKYPIGERHAFLLYLKSDINSELDFTKAEDVVKDFGLNEIELSKGGKLSLEKLNTDEKKEYYNNAIETGMTLIVYSDPL